MLPRFLIAATLCLLPLPLLAQAPAAPAAEAAEAARVADEGGPPPRMASLIVFGNDPCPRSNDDEIVVCARLPESERFRLPKRFRGKRPEDAPAVESWSNRVAVLESVSRIGTPNSCSPVGSGGQTGCYSKFMQQYRAERRQAASEAASVP